ncbi:pyridoxamine 5'-phosphate oxidase [Pseudomonas phage PMBT14]|uniref:Pyridoxamine 5'-phosphate oxidase n=1 Tax=Pseudomonas phage PMBT14 TaxID=2059855 RepID=A0A2I6PIB0_9CAUD|nr:pyridoxamine 5'-phosphate oxidase [Pseudomonas phage PMBT14]AUM59795.1 pyridoxamine 5'-phosphate oxidase [Pseudomonas phage PMBT14]
MTKVMGIHGNVAPGEPVPSVVALLEKVLEQAKAGEITAVALATVQTDGRCWNDWAHKADYFTLLGSLARLQQRLVSD